MNEAFNKYTAKILTDLHDNFPKITHLYESDAIELYADKDLYEKIAEVEKKIREANEYLDYIDLFRMLLDAKEDDGSSEYEKARQKTLEAAKAEPILIRNKAGFESQLRELNQQVKDLRDNQCEIFRGTLEFLIDQGFVSRKLNGYQLTKNGFAKLEMPFENGQAKGSTFISAIKMYSQVTTGKAVDAALSSVFSFLLIG